jgi:hypothetical protein
MIATSITPNFYLISWVGLCLKRGSVYCAKNSQKWVKFQRKTTRFANSCFAPALPPSYHAIGDADHTVCCVGWKAAPASMTRKIAEARYSALINVRKVKKMNIDTEIRHVTKPGANLFLDLGFSAEEAKRLKAASRKQIYDAQLVKEQLMSESVKLPIG